ncbi:MAG: LLM class flavin-dependent oxidoreductase [Gammaproteobacteria bacterium]|nr:LLM class flavin-dependent oxidoreductase [Gammaproteobacteria bacterium]MCP4088884.1 LLM class flavin-dependent oxidoreductase [Gammaproteobacteria bacterium]MCP4274900.1 LLM class flavin-dependent oxidoreductase [Gammaproteobacteria bacterium]MCP4832033.1 LLM class flavin-dependent oxidoreductase [Gammaproteobacteria bacterium]MCP4928366.1 LLM class flavin-dependent oxidoreductase [Gammaproteobacteria bacterium]
MTQFGLVMEPSAGYTARLAGKIEAMGFDYLLCPDTQNLAPDPYGQLSLASATTTSLQLGTGVTNPITRDAAVTATALMSLQQESMQNGGRGRTICVIGRGDSSAAHIGKHNATTKQLRTYVKQLQAYMHGETIMRGEKESALRWLKGLDIPPVPVDIACTGPKTIQMAVETGDRISFAVGSAPERITWAINTATEQLQKIGRSRDSVSIGAFINLVCDPDEQRAINIGRMIAGMVAHFAGMKNASLDHLPPQLKELAAHMQKQYDMDNHAQEEAGHSTEVSDDFVNWFSICGPAKKCEQRLKSIIDLGLDHIYILAGSPIAHPHGERQAGMVEQSRLFAEQVMPKFK